MIFVHHRVLLFIRDMETIKYKKVENFFRRFVKFFTSRLPLSKNKNFGEVYPYTNKIDWVV